MLYKFRNNFLLVCLITLLASACQPGLTDQEPYPLPPATQALATLLARGVATGETREYPAPIGGPMAPTPTGAILQLTDVYPAPQVQPTPGEPAALLASRHFLAGRLGLEVRQVRLVSWEEASWITPNLGCQPSGVYSPQSPTLGYRIILRASSQDYELHTDQSGENICQADPLQPGERLPLRRDLTSDETAEMARQHLASRSGLSLEAITIKSVEPTEWEDASLGCALPPGNQPDRANARPIPGYRILLDAPDGQYEYHSGGFWLAYCGVK
jgi:hypothetical protein